jgi:putative membrane protein
MMRYLAIGTASIVLLIVVVFSVQNLEAVDVRFAGWSMTVPKFLLVAASYLLGMFTGGAVFGIFRRARRKAKRDRE